MLLLREMPACSMIGKSCCMQRVIYAQGRETDSRERNCPPPRLLLVKLPLGSQVQNDTLDVDAGRRGRLIEVILRRPAGEVFRTVLIVRHTVVERNDRHLIYHDSF